MTKKFSIPPRKAGFAAGLSLAASLGATTLAAQEIAITPSEDLFRKLQEQTEGVAPPVIKFMQEQGTKFTYLGNAGGLDGYLGETPTGKLQTFYVTPDGQHVIAGILFRQGGINLTGVQMNDLRNRYEDARRKAAQARKEVENATPEDIVIPQATGALVEVPPEAVAAGEVKMATSDEFLSARDAKEMKAALDRTPWFQVGAPDVPVVYKVADPNCPFCHEAWKVLRPMVMKREIAVRVILIAGLKGSKAEAISILSREKPFQAWMAGEGSVGTTAVASPPAATSAEFRRGESFLNQNMQFISEAEVTSTPHFFYLDEEDQLYESEGMPRDFNAFLGALKKE